MVVGLLGFILIAAWLLLSSSLLATARGNLTARILSDKLGQTIDIKGGVRVNIGTILHVTADGVAVPSPSMADVSLAEVGQLDFDAPLIDLLKGQINLSGLQATGAIINLLAEQDGTTSWSESGAKPSNDVSSASSGNEAEQNSPAKSAGKNSKLADFLVGREIRFVDSGLIYKDARNGLDIDLLLTSLDLSQKDKSSPAILQGEGKLNGQELALNGNFSQKQPFKVTAAFSQIDVVLDGTPDQDGYSTAISVTIAELGQLLDVLKLEKTISGSGHVKAALKTSNGSARVEGLDVLVTLDGGQSLVVKGDLGKLGDPSDVTLDTIIRLYSEANRPPATTTRRDLKLIGVDMQLIAQPDGIPQRRMVIETNGFVLDTSGEGPPPISFSKISRTPDGHVKIGEIILRIGPPEANFLVLEGRIADALRLDGIDVEGTLALPVASLIAPELFQTSDVLGNVAGVFHLRGNLDGLSLTDLSAEAKGTNLWHLNIVGSVKDVLKIDGVKLDVAADIPSGADLLSALNLEPIKTGPVKLTTSLSSHGTEWTSEAAVVIAESQLEFSLDLDVDDPNPVARGKIESDLIRIEHIRDIVAASLQLAKLDDQKEKPSQEDTSGQEEAPTDTPTEGEDDKVTEPLVLPKPGDSDTSAEAIASDPPGPFRDVTLHPLGRAVLLSGMDLSVTIDLRKIEGEKGTSSLSTDLEMKDQKARLGPMKVEYDGGHFDISAAMDMKESPGILNLSGSTGGWDFGKIMQELRVKKRVSGVLNASFDVSGGHSSVKDFLATMNGGATVSVNNGSIDSQLLDLAGLGVIPWLFSKHKGKTAPIVCAHAPLHISNGRISTKQTVVETDQVQIVVFGNVDLNHKTLDIHGQPRRIAKPLSRSPWPFTAVGPMAKPKIKVKDGPRRLKRSDGASTMPQKRKLCVPDILQLQ